MYYLVLAFLQTYGWFLIFGFVLSMVIWSNFEKPLRQFFQKRKRQFDVTDNMSMYTTN